MSVFSRTSHVVLCYIPILDRENQMRESTTSPTKHFALKTIFPQNLWRLNELVWTAVATEQPFMANEKPYHSYFEVGIKNRVSVLVSKTVHILEQTSFFPFLESAVWFFLWFQSKFIFSYLDYLDYVYLNENISPCNFFFSLKATVVFPL